MAHIRLESRVNIDREILDRENYAKNGLFWAVFTGLFNSGTSDRNRCKPLQAFILVPLLQY
jgi:hypothetical protein